MRITIILAIILATGCNDVETVTYDNKSDTTEKSIDQTEIMNDSSRLPRDTINTGVQH